VLDGLLRFGRPVRSRSAWPHSRSSCPDAGRRRTAQFVSVARRLDRLERLAPRRDCPRLDAAARDAEIERLAAEYEAREGPGAFAALLAEIEAEFEAAGDPSACHS
jgi:hypothetical protein